MPNLESKAIQQRSLQWRLNRRFKAKRQGGSSSGAICQALTPLTAMGVLDRPTRAFSGGGRSGRILDASELTLALAVLMALTLPLSNHAHAQRLPINGGTTVNGLGAGGYGGKVSIDSLNGGDGESSIGGVKVTRISTDEILDFNRGVSGGAGGRYNSPNGKNGLDGGTGRAAYDDFDEYVRSLLLYHPDKSLDLESFYVLSKAMSGASGGGAGYSNEFRGSKVVQDFKGGDGGNGGRIIVERSSDIGGGGGGGGAGGDGLRLKNLTVVEIDEAVKIQGGHGGMGGDGGTGLNGNSSLILPAADYKIFYSWSNNAAKGLYGNGGKGGAGGVGLVFENTGGQIAELINSGSIFGGNGGRGGLAPVSSPKLTVVDIGGDAGGGVVFSGRKLMNNKSGKIAGGNAADTVSSNNLHYYNAPVGSGGFGVFFSGDLLDNSGEIAGGNGGTTIGFNGNYIPGGRSGGDGGAGVKFVGGELINSGKILGGKALFYASQVAGVGGDGVTFSGQKLVNSGVIAGGDSGKYINRDTGSVSTAAGVGVNIKSAGAHLVNSGSISGGKIYPRPDKKLTQEGEYSVKIENAVRFVGDGSRMEIWSGSLITGDVTVASGGKNNAFVLGGQEDASFDISAVGDARQYQGFDRFEKLGDSTWALTGVGSSLNPWAVRAGRLSVSADASLGKQDATLLLDGGALAVTGTEFSSTARAIEIGAAGGAIEVADAAHSFTVQKPITGAGGLSKRGQGGLILAGDSEYQGGTVIDSGSLQLGNGGANGGIVGNVRNAGEIIFNRSDEVTFGGAISGSGAVQQSGSGTTILTGKSDYTGGTIISAGSLQLGDGNTSGEISGNVINNASLAFKRSDAIVFSGNISGSGHVKQMGGGSTFLTGANNYAGNTEISAGSLQFGQGAAGGHSTLGGDVAVAGGELAINMPATVAVAGNVSLGAGSQLSLAARLDSAPALSSKSMDLGGNVGFNLTSIQSTGELNGVLINTDQGIAGDFSKISIGGYAGPVDYMELHTRKSADGKQYLVSYELAWVSAANPGQSTFTLTHASDAFTIGAALADQPAGGSSASVAKTLIKEGAGTLVLAQNNVYTGGTKINGGTLQLGQGATEGSITGDVENRGILAFNRSNALDFAGVISGAGAVQQLGTGTTILTGTSSYAGGTTIAAGALQLGDGGASGSIIGDVLNHGVLSFNRLNALAMDSSISGSGSVLQAGTGTTTLTGSNSYTGGTTVAAGVLVAGSANALVDNTAYRVASGATLNLQGHSLQASSLTGGGTVALGTAALTLRSDANLVFDGDLQGAGQLIKQGAGVLALNGASTMAGGVQLKQGRIDLGNAQGLGTGALAMDDDTRLGLTRNGMVVANDLHMTGSKDPVIDTGANDVSWAGQITGDGFLTKQGTGRLTLTSTGNRYTGATDIAQGQLQAGAAHTFSAASAHSVAAAASMNLAGFDQTLASLSNSGTVLLSGSAVGTTLKVTGAYVGHQGHLAIATVLNGNASASDRLLLSGPAAVASGSTALQISNVGGLGAPTTGNGIEIIRTENGARLESGAFTLAAGHVDAGAFEYRLQQTSEVASLQSSYRNEAALVSALPAQLRQADMAMLGNMRQRLGDEASSIGNDAGDGRRAWGRILRTDPRIRQSGTVSPESSGHLTGFQAGLDLYADPGVKAGLYVGELQGNMSVKGFASGVEGKSVGYNHLQSRYLGLYGSWQSDAGLYADSVVQWADYRSNLQADNSTAATHGSGWLTSLEVGQPFAINSQWQIEPQAQLVYRQISLDDTALSGAQVQHHTPSDWTLRLGARIKGSWATSAGTLQPFGSINVYKASRTSDVARFGTPAASTDIQAQGGYTSTALAAGAALQINQRTSVYGELGRHWASGGDTRVKSGLQASLGVKVRW